MKKHTVISKKYVKLYKNQPIFKPKSRYVIGCVYYGNNRSNHLKLGMLMEVGDKTSTLKLRDGTKVKVKNITLKSAQIEK